MKKAELALLIGLIIAVFSSGFSSFAAACRDIETRVLRLHILANSDSEEDQALKYAVRDRVLNDTQHLFYDAQSLLEAETDAAAALDEIQSVARDEVRRQGYDYPVKAELVRDMFFDTRTYDDFALPAGRYDAVRITIGAAKGHNWWCVLYPPLCLPAAEHRTKIGDVLTEEETKIVEHKDKYEIRFAAVELFERIRSYFSS